MAECRVGPRPDAAATGAVPDAVPEVADPVGGMIGQGLLATGCDRGEDFHRQRSQDAGKKFNGGADGGNGKGGAG